MSGRLDFIDWIVKPLKSSSTFELDSGILVWKDLSVGSVWDGS